MSLTYFYPWAYLAAFLGLLGWTLFKDRRSLAGLFRSLFLLGFVSWILVLVGSEGSNPYKLTVIFRDLLVLGIAATLLGRARSNMIVGLAFLIGASLFIQQFYLPILKSTFGKSIIDLDPDGELLLELDGEAEITSLEAILAAYDAEIHSIFDPQDRDVTDLDDYYIVDVPTHRISDLAELKVQLQESPQVDWVENNEMIQIDPLETTTKENRGKPVGVNDPQAIHQWAFEALEITDLHQLLHDKKIKSEKTALVAVLDTGVDGKHEDLQTNYRSLDPKFDRDGNGHGTHVAGIVAATTNNGIGVASMIADEKRVEVTSIKVLSDVGFGSQAKIIQGMILAADMGADVVSMSLGGPSTDTKQEAYRKAVAYCADKGAIVVVAAGNASINAKTYAPANTPGVIVVTAINDKLQKATFSNEVQDLTFGVAAPGEDIMSTFPKNQYRSFKGTSMAAPYVSSMVAILKSIDPKLTTDRIYEILHQSGKDTDQVRRTGKIIQPVAAVNQLLTSKLDS